VLKKALSTLPFNATLEGSPTSAAAVDLESKRRKKMGIGRKRKRDKERSRNKDPNNIQDLTTLYGEINLRGGIKNMWQFDRWKELGSFSYPPKI